MADILLTVGVDSSLSYSEFQSGISALVSKINSKPIEIKVKPQIDQSAMAELKKQISAVSSTASKTNVRASSGSSYMQGIANGAKAANSQISATTSHLNAVKAALKEIGATNSNITSAYKKLSASLEGSTATGQNAADLSAMKTKYVELQNAVENLRSTKSAATQEDINNIYRLQTEMQQLINKTRERVNAENEAAAATERATEAALKEINTTNANITSAYKKLSANLGGGAATGQNATDLDALREKYVELQNAVEDLRNTKSTATEEDINNIYRLQTEMQKLINTTNERVNAENKATQTDKERIQVTDKYSKTIDQMRKAVKNYSAAEYSNSSSSTDAYAEIKAGVEGLESAFAAFNSGQISSDALKQKIEEANTAFLKNSSIIKDNGDAHKTWGEEVGGLASKFSSWLTVSQLIMYAVNSIRKMVSASIELDTAMTELKKVTDETDTTYSHFLENAETRAKTIGSSLTDIVNATADFARLGYNIDEASELADVATIYNNVGDDVESISDASDSIIATMQAFGISADDAMSIVDKFNEVGKHIMPSNTVMCY